MIAPATGPTRVPATAAPTRVIDPSILYLGTPVILLSTVNEDGSPNLAPTSSLRWLDKTGLLGIASRSHTVHNLRRGSGLVINVASVDMADAVDALAATTGSNPVPDYKQAMGFRHVRDKFARAGLTALPSETTNAMRVAEAPIQIECEVVDIRTVGRPEEHSTAVEVYAVRTHVHESILKPGHRHHIDPDAYRPLLMSFLEFYGLGERPRRSTLAKFF